MDRKKLLAAVDHTLLRPDASWEEIRALCDEAIYYGTASVCIPPVFVKAVREYVGDRMAICTVIGFPNGYSAPEVKIYEAERAVEDGADEIDMVMQIGAFKSGRAALAAQEIRAVREACRGKILKVIVEACLLTEEEKIAACRMVTEEGADFIKTSTGFSAGGATFEDVALFARHVGKGVRIKAAGGIQTLEDAERFLELGASRIGSSRIVALVAKEREKAESGPSGMTEKAESGPSGMTEKAESGAAGMAEKAESGAAGAAGSEKGSPLWTEEKKRELIAAAFGVLEQAYVPYSQFHVAAALLAADGTIYTGVNIENASYPATNCAERTAFFKAVSGGCRDFTGIAICGGSGGTVTDYCAPCGVCRQVMREFCRPQEFRILLARSVSDYKEYTLEELLPESFGPANLGY